MQNWLKAIVLTITISDLATKRLNTSVIATPAYQCPSFLAPQVTALQKNTSEMVSLTKLSGKGSRLCTCHSQQAN